MSKRSLFAMLLGAAGACLFCAGFITELDAQAKNQTAGPPQYLTLPILLHVAEPGLDHGPFVFGGEAAVPTPLAHEAGATTYNPAQVSTAALTRGTDRDVSD